MNCMWLKTINKHIMVIKNMALMLRTKIFSLNLNLDNNRNGGKMSQFYRM